jgi:ADP-ribose pyrophosphatase
MLPIVRPEPKYPIPPQAACVFKGELFDVFQWQQEQFDGSFLTYEKLRKADSTCVIPVLEDGSILVQEEEQAGMYAFATVAGGRLNPSEEVLEGAVRELHEETGYAATQWRLVSAGQYIEKIDSALYILAAGGCKKAAEPRLDAGERIVIRTVSFEDFLDIAISTRFRNRELGRIVLEARVFPEKMQELRDAILGEGK